jgi:4-amino-4-deoxy-L-arabinose transferase-like glycosyltransferase
LAEKEITFELKNPELIVLMVFLAFVFYLELQVTFNTPISFGDEGFHTRISQWIAENVEYPVWVPFYETPVAKSSFERQPYWNMIEASFFYLIGFNEGIVKFLVPMISLMTGIVVYLFAKDFYNSRVGFMASVILVTLPSFVTYSVLVYTDALITFLLLMFIYMFSRSIKTGRRLHMLAAGAFGALTFMTKLTGYIVYAVVGIVFLYFMYKEKKFLPVIKRYLPILLMLILIPSAMFIRSYRYYNTPVCYRLPIVSKITDMFINYDGCWEIDYEEEREYAGRTDGGGTEADVFTMGIMNYLTFAYGDVWAVIFPLFAGIFLVLSRKSTRQT